MTRAGQRRLEEALGPRVVREEEHRHLAGRQARGGDRVVVDVGDDAVGDVPELRQVEALPPARDRDLGGPAPTVRDEDGVAGAVVARACAVLVEGRVRRPEVAADAPLRVRARLAGGHANAAGAPLSGGQVWTVFPIASTTLCRSEEHPAPCTPPVPLPVRFTPPAPVLEDAAPPVPVVWLPVLVAPLAPLPPLPAATDRFVALQATTSARTAGNARRDASSLITPGFQPPPCVSTRCHGASPPPLPRPAHPPSPPSPPASVQEGTM